MNTIMLEQREGRWAILMNTPNGQTVCHTYRTKKEALSEMSDWMQIAAVELGGHVVNN